MSAKTRQKTKAQDQKRDLIARLAGLHAGSIDLIQQDQRQPEAVESLLQAHQLFKENKLGGCWTKIGSAKEGEVLEGFHQWFSSMKEGDIWKLGQYGHLSCGELTFGLPQVCDANEWVAHQAYADLVMNLIAPMMALFTGFTLKYVRALDRQGDLLRILTKDMEAYYDNDEHTREEVNDLYEFEFKVIKAK